MKPKVHYIPDGFRAVTPYLFVQDAARAIEFYMQAFGAREVMRMPMPNGKIGHAEIQIGDSRIMLADEAPQINARSPVSVGGTPVLICLYVEDCDAVIARAVALGAKVSRPAQDHFYGDRSGTLTDPFGHLWTVATHKEDVTIEETQKRAAALFGAK
ncbi:MAG: VOC family protein [Verrucomicrobiota bacterium]|jgi:PhnB protein